MTTLGSDSSGSPAVVALIPAQNEETTIVESITSLFGQEGITLQKVLVVADNCTDRTVERARALREDYPNLEVIESQGNRTGKPGALNQGFLHLLGQPADYIIQMDSDTVLGKKCLENAAKLLEAKPNLGGTCARFTLIPPPSNARWISRVLWQFQNVEFWFEDASVISSNGKNPRFLSGRASVFRYEALTGIYNDRGFVWDERTDVEDKAISLDLKEKQWQIAVGMKMRAATSAPLTVSELVSQRLRWEGGSIALLGRTWLSKHARKDLLALFLTCFVWLPIRLLSLIWLCLLIPGYVEFHFSWLILVINAGAWSYLLWKLIVTRGCGLWGNLVIVTLVPWELYMLARDLLIVVSLVLNVFSLPMQKRDTRPFTNRTERSRAIEETE